MLSSHAFSHNYQGNRNMSARNAFYAQSGGVTAVINATACGVIETARKHRNKIKNVYAGRNGIIGALTEDMIDTNRESAKTIAALRHTPGGAFGSARYKLKSLEENQAEYERLRALGVHFTTAPTDTGGVILAVFDDTCGNLIQLIQA